MPLWDEIATATVSPRNDARREKSAARNDCQRQLQWWAAAGGGCVPLRVGLEMALLPNEIATLIAFARNDARGEGRLAMTHEGKGGSQ